VRGLTIVVADAAAVRLASALRIAAAQAALGGPVRLFFDADAVAALPALAGEPAALLDTCLALGVEVTVCQSGLAAAGLDAATLDPRFAFGGLTGTLATAAEDRLLLA
jgi:predicted peroxiredoxin